MAGKMFPEAFCASTERLLGAADMELLLKALESESPVSIRFNPYKVTSKPEGRGVPWCRYGYYLDGRPQFTLDPQFHAGAYYVQEASSMIIEDIFRSQFEDNDGLRILDLCASPGGKTTLLSTLAGAESLVVANEVIRSRAVTLADNVCKWGVGNVAVTNNDPSHFAGFEHFFDCILVDAPCSGEGMFRKSEEARTEWSEANVKLCAARSRRIISDIWASLRPGGVFIFSTCTFNETENEDTVRWMLEEFDCEGVEFTVNPAWGVVQGDVGGVPTLRFFPHKVDGEGLFAAVLRKGDGKVRRRIPKPRKTIFAELNNKDRASVQKWFNGRDFMKMAAIGDNIYSYYSSVFTDVRAIAESMTVIYSGVVAGQLFGGKLRPEHSLAMFCDLNRNEVNIAELNLEQAQNYLRKAEFDVTVFAEGLNLVCFDGLAIGWVKRIGQRVNNGYPKELRILNL